MLEITDIFYSSAITCEALNDANSNSNIEYTSSDDYAHGSTATYVCEEGFYLTGDVTRTCEGTAQPGTWSDSEKTAAPVCQRKSPGGACVNRINLSVNLEFSRNL